MGPEKFRFLSKNIPSLKISVNKRGEQSGTIQRKNKPEECATMGSF